MLPFRDILHIYSPFSFIIKCYIYKIWCIANAVGFRSTNQN